MGFLVHEPSPKWAFTDAFTQVNKVPALRDTAVPACQLLPYKVSEGACKISQYVKTLAAKQLTG